MSYDRDKKNEREYQVQEGEPADTDLLHTDVIVTGNASGEILFAQEGSHFYMAPYYLCVLLEISRSHF
ncbi:hypothetical protein A943_05610 [Bacillus sp. CPSM8]|nr:hypothetical protein A943_05610 [Bacillus sp. CPSM8]TAI52047.1 hypothetical protein CXP52_06630 [Bacillus paralicheniformis]